MSGEVAMVLGELSRVKRERDEAERALEVAEARLKPAEDKEGEALRKLAKLVPLWLGFTQEESDTIWVRQVGPWGDLKAYYWRISGTIAVGEPLVFRDSEHTPALVRVGDWVDQATMMLTVERTGVVLFSIRLMSGEVWSRSGSLRGQVLDSVKPILVSAFCCVLNQEG